MINSTLTVAGAEYRSKSILVESTTFTPTGEHLSMLLSLWIWLEFFRFYETNWIIKPRDFSHPAHKQALRPTELTLTIKHPFTLYHTLVPMFSPQIPHQRSTTKLSLIHTLQAIYHGQLTYKSSHLWNEKRNQSMRRPTWSKEECANFTLEFRVEREPRDSGSTSYTIVLALFIKFSLFFIFL